MVDDKDFDWANGYKWYFSNGYARRKIKDKPIYLHREINKTPQGLVTDHINQNKLDNRKENLRTATKKGNSRNHKLLATNTSGFNGLSWNKAMKKWETYLWKNNVKIQLGYFPTQELAYQARQEGERTHWND